MTHLALALLGPFQAKLDGQPAEGLNSDRLRALLAYLAVDSGREHTREEVAALLWAERPDREALSALRYALSNLHAALDDRDAPSPFLLVTRTTVQFNPDSDHWLDVDEFQNLKGRSDVAALERAVTLYRGPFLHGLSVGDSPAFDEWMLLQGEAYRREVLLVLGHLTSLQIERGEHQQAARWARRQIELEPYREQAHRQLMAALALGGERSAALAHYETCRRLLAEELGCEPEDETQVLYARIRDGSFPRPGPPLRVASTPSSPVTSGDQPLPRFVAREQELARLDALLDQALAGQGGVALVSGEAGAGKTALLEEFARRATEARADLIAMRGRCNAHGDAGDPYLPFREILQTLAGDIEGKRAGGTLSQEQARRVQQALPVVGAALVEHGPDLIDTFVPSEALLRRADALPAPGSAGGRPGERWPAGQGWQARLGEMLTRAEHAVAAVPQPDLFAQVTQVLHIVSLERPLLLALDDLQWADGGTQALLFHLSRRLAGSRLLLACAFRPEALHAGVGDGAESPGVGTVLQELRREWGDVLIDLDQADGRRFVDAYVDSEPNRLSAAFRQSLYQRTGGNALFTVELLRSFEREGALQRDEAGLWIEGKRLDWEHWPPQVEAVIAGHLVALPDEDRALLQAASVQGEQFAAEVAARVLGWDEETAIQRLSGPLRTRHRLVEAVSLDRLASTGQYPPTSVGRAPATGSGQRLSHYRFRHWLVQRGAYGGLDPVARARLHEETGRALEAIYEAAGVKAASLEAELARHYEAAGLPLVAAPHRLEAGRWAARLAAYDEAIAHLERGLALLEAVAPSPQRLQLELGLWVAMSTPIMMQRGLQAPAYARALERLSDLIQHPDLYDDSQRLAALTVLALSAGWSADPVRSGRVGQQLLDLAPSAGSGQAQDGHQQTLLLGNWALGFSHWLRGQPVSAHEYLGRALTLYDPEASRPLGGSLVGDPGVMARVMLGAVQWQLGYPDQARASFRQAVAQAEGLEQPSSVVFAHYVAAMATSVVGRDMAAALHHAEALRPLGQVSLVYRTWAETLAGQAQAQCEQADTGAAEPGPQQGLARVVEAGSTWQDAGSGGGYAGLMLLQAEVCARVGRVEMGLRALDRAQDWIQRSGMRATEAEAWRMRGDLLLLEAAGAEHPVPVAEAEACFQRALDIAREQQARIFELRTAVRLARLWQARDRRGEARELLTGIYGWFTEGFDTVDLIEAKALLEALE